MKVLLKVRDVFVVAVVALVVLFVLLTVGVRAVGLRPFAVVSPSMEPDYPVGSLIYVADIAPEEVAVDDVITFVMNADLDIGTHRVVAIDTENSYFYTQGDANQTADQTPVHFRNLIGRPVFVLPLLGYLTTALASPAGIATAVIVMLAVIVLAFLPELIIGDKRRPMSRSERKKLR